MLRRVAMSLALMLALVAMPAAAQAAPRSQTPDVADIPLPHNPVLREAAKNGQAQLVVTEMHIEQDPSSGSGVTTQGVTPGNCGLAFMWMFSQGPSIYQEWGFSDLTILATSYAWSYSVIGPGVFSRNDAGSGTLLFRREWTGSVSYSAPHGGTYSGFASLRASNGVTVCTGAASDSVFH